MSRGRYIALVAVALVVGGAVFAWQNVPRDNATKATVGDAVREFRRSIEQEGRGLPGGSELGVYRYEIHGGESVDAAFLGARHNYGGVATIAITPRPCGIEERWQVLRGRWTEAELCRTEDASRLVGLRDSHEFFGEVRLNDYSCEGDEIPAAADQRPGMRWTFRCEADDASIDNTTRVIALERIEVGGETFDTVRTRSSIGLEGEADGVGRREEWRRRSDGLLLRRIDDVEATIDVVGPADYDEHYTLDLISPEPQR